MSYVFQIKYIGSNMIQCQCLVDNFIIHCVIGGDALALALK